MPDPDGAGLTPHAAPDVWRAGWLARIATIVLAGSWVSLVTFLVGLSMSSGREEEAWFRAMGLGVLGAAVLDAVLGAHSLLVLDEKGLRLRFSLRRQEARWEGIGGIHFLERMSGSPLGGFSEEVEIRILARDGREILAIPGPLGSRAHARIAEVAAARGFAKHEQEGGEAAHVLLAPDAPAVLLSVRAPGTRSRAVALASRGFAGALVLTVPFAVMAGREAGIDFESMIPLPAVIGCGGVFIGLSGLIVALAFHRVLGDRGHRRLHLRLLGASALGIVLGYLAGAVQLSAEKRAVRAKADAIVRKLEQYRATTGAYPNDLRALPGPVDTRVYGRDQTQTIEYNWQGDWYILVYFFGSDTHSYDSSQGKWEIHSHD